jgi:hypothetical protein
MLQFRATQLIITIGLILSIVGGTSSISPSGTFTVQTTSKAGLLLSAVGWAIVTLRTIFTIPQFSSHTSEKRIAIAVIIALPLIAVRIIYSLLAVFLHNHDFSLINGSVTIWVVMAVLEEIFVVIIYLIVGWKAEALPANQRGPLTSRPWKGPLNPAQSSGRRQGPIHTLVDMAVAAASDRTQGHDVEKGPVDQPHRHVAGFSGH